MDIDYAVLQKTHRNDANPEKRYSPAVCLGCKVEEVHGSPTPSTSPRPDVERRNLTSVWGVEEIVGLLG